MLTSKQRAKLRSLANNEQTILHIGKGGVIDTLIIQVQDALTARELIKIKVLENCPLTAKEAAFELSEKTESEIVSVIGFKIILYKKNLKKSVIDI